MGGGLQVCGRPVHKTQVGSRGGEEIGRMNMLAQRLILQAQYIELESYEYNISIILQSGIEFQGNQFSIYFIDRAECARGH